MKKILSFFVPLMPLLVLSQTYSVKRTAGELTIHGTLKNLKEPVSYVYIISLDGNDGTDSVKVINNNYIFRVKTKATTLITLYSGNPNMDEYLKDKYMFAFTSEPATVTVVSTDSFSNAKVTGSKADFEYHKLNAQLQPYSKQLSTLYADYRKEQKDEQNDRVRNTQRLIDTVEYKLNNYRYQYLKTHPSSLLRHYLLSSCASQLKGNSPIADIKKVKLMYNTLSVEDRNSYYGRRIKKKLDSYNIGIGMMAPAFIQNDTLGNPISLTSFKGKYVLLDFWASWCGPCRSENPNLVNAFKTYGDKGFTIMSISLDRLTDKIKWMDAIHKDGLTWTHVSDLKYWNNSAAKLYEVTSIPRNFLLDPSGKIIGKDLRGVLLQEKLSEVLK